GRPRHRRGDADDDELGFCPSPRPSPTAESAEVGDTWWEREARVSFVLQMWRRTARALRVQRHCRYQRWATPQNCSLSGEGSLMLSTFFQGIRPCVYQPMSQT